MATDRDVPRRIDEDHPSLPASHQRLEGLRLGGITTKEAMGAKQPEVAGPTDLWRAGICLGHFVGRRIQLGGAVEAFDHEVDLGRLEARNLEIEIEVPYSADRAA